MKRGGYLVVNVTEANLLAEKTKVPNLPARDLRRQYVPTRKDEQHKNHAFFKLGDASLKEK